jgi:hypothetical protein
LERGRILNIPPYFKIRENKTWPICDVVKQYKPDLAHNTLLVELNLVKSILQQNAKLL